jgi:hypothetical protein
MMKKLFLTGIAALVCISIMAQQGAALKLNPEKGKTYRFRSSSNQTIVQTINGNQQTVESSSNNAVSIKMVDITPAFIVAEVRIDTVASRTNAMGKITTMSSATEGNVESKEAQDVMSYFMNKLTKTPLYAKIDFTGKVTEIVNLKMVAPIVIKDTSLIKAAEPVGSALKQQVASLVNESSLKSTIEVFTYNLPAKEVAKGETWSTQNSTNAGGMALDITTTYTLDDIAGNTATVSAESKIAASPNAAPMKQGPATITYESLKGMSKSTLIVDTATGLSSSHTAKTMISGTLGVTVPGMSLEMPMEITSTSTATLVK